MLKFIDPLALFDLMWRPKFPAGFYARQKEIIYSVRDNEETFVPAGNMLGKDFVTGFIVVWFFLSAIKVGATCRVVTTSVRDDHLDILWGEMGRFISTAAYSLLDDAGGPLHYVHRDITRAKRRGEAGDDISYIKGIVCSKGEGMAGHHADYTLVAGDEASGIDKIVFTQSATWAKRSLWIGNCNPCNNPFFEGVQGGDIPMEVA